MNLFILSCSSSETGTFKTPGSVQLETKNVIRVEISRNERINIMAVKLVEFLLHAILKKIEKILIYYFITQKCKIMRDTQGSENR